MAEYLSPGVYVEEFESGSRPMEGVSTSTAGFIGLAVRGPIQGVPQLITNAADFKRKYGGYLSENEFGNYRFLAYAVDQFFINGGSRCFVMRVCPEDAAGAAREIGCLKINAVNPGVWGNNVKMVFTPASKGKTQITKILEENGKKQYVAKSAEAFSVGDVVVCICNGDKEYNRVTKIQDKVMEFENDFACDVVDNNVVPTTVIQSCEFDLEVSYEDNFEKYEAVSFNIEAASFIEKKVAKSDLVKIEFTGDVKELAHPYVILSGSEDLKDFIVSLEGGLNGSLTKVDDMTFVGDAVGGPGKRTGLQAFIDNDVVSIMAIPGVVSANVQLQLVAHCENLGSRFAILDLPRDSKKVDDVITHRNIFDSHYAALYHPWLEVYDPLDKKNTAIPPAGTVAGIYSRSDVERGVHKAPANEVLRGVTGLDCIYNKGEQDILNPKGVNLIRAFPGQGIRVWGARTCSSNTLWKYVNVRRLFIFLEESIKANTNWVVFEPNDELLWIRVRRTITVFLTTIWRNGALTGSSPEEAFFVDIGHSTMTQDDIDNGRMICVIGVAPVKPAEFVIFRITQRTREE